jgi:uncharacterized protein YndB with AHSA1/START domain
MTEDKARKRAIRQRMAKTGERYTAARRHTLKDATKPALPERVADPGVSDQAIRRGTGKGWDEWLRILDAWDATSRSHREIAGYLHQEHGVSGWWSQSVTVGYERARGMRAKYEHATGFAVSVSKTIGVDADRLYAAFTEARRRGRWLEPGTLRVRTTQKGRTARFDFRDGSSRILASFDPKGRSKTTVTVAHERLPDADAVEELRSFWRERLARLAEVLG